MLMPSSGTKCLAYNNIASQSSTYDSRATRSGSSSGRRSIEATSASSSSSVGSAIAKTVRLTASDFDPNSAVELARRPTPSIYVG